MLGTCGWGNIAAGAFKFKIGYGTGLLSMPSAYPCSGSVQLGMKLHVVSCSAVARSTSQPCPGYRPDVFQMSCLRLAGAASVLSLALTALGLRTSIPTPEVGWGVTTKPTHHFLHITHTKRKHSRHISSDNGSYHIF